MDGGGDAVDVQDAREGEAAQARADERDRCRHGVFFEVMVERCSIRTRGRAASATTLRRWPVRFAPVRAARCGRGRCRSAGATTGRPVPTAVRPAGEHDQTEAGGRGAYGDFGDADQEIGAARELQRGRFGGRGRHHPAGEAESREGVVDRVAEVPTSRDGDVFGGGVPLGGDGSGAGEGVSPPHDGDEAGLAHLLGADVGCARTVGVRLQIDLAMPQLGGVDARFRDEAQSHARRLSAYGREQRGATHGDQGIVPAECESAFQGCRIEFTARCEHAPDLVQQLVHLLPDGDRVGRRGHGAAGAHQDLVAGRAPDPAQAPAHRGGGDVQSCGRSGHAALLQQRVERGEQIQIQLHGSNPSRT